MRSGEAERGVTLVALVMIVTVMSVMVTAALPTWSTKIRREKEEELAASLAADTAAGNGRAGTAR